MAELKRLKEAHENMTCCVVCLDAPRSVLLLPCKHLALCEECSQSLQASSRDKGTGSGSCCPVCRVQVLQHISGVYMTAVNDQLNDVARTGYEGGKDPLRLAVLEAVEFAGGDAEAGAAAAGARQAGRHLCGSQVEG
eukprot:gene7565-7772_t